MTEARKLDVAERERAIIRYLRELEEPESGATIPQIYRHLTERGVALISSSEPVRDSVTQPVYYKLIRRLVLAEQLQELPGDEDGKRYALAPHLHAATALTLDDINELVTALAPTEAIAAMIDAREYLRSHRGDSLRPAADALRQVDPRELIFEMIITKVNAYNADVELLEESGADDERHRRRIKNALADLEKICYYWLGLSWSAVRVPPASGIEKVKLDLDELRKQLARRVYGDSAIQHVPFDNPSAPKSWANVVVAGSDGSTYSSVMQLDTGAAFVADVGNEVVTFNTSVVYLEMYEENKARHPHRLYSVPLTRSAIDSPDNAGMVMARFMYRDDGLGESDYEHMAKCATDVVQWRADERVFLGNARALGDGRELPAPRVHFRDGTVTLQERESNHYQRNDSYGEMVRNGVRLSHAVLQHIRGRRQPPVFAGAVKSSQLHMFATIVNWFIAHGLRARGIPPIDPNWDVARASMLPDNEAMTLLLSSIYDERGDGFFCTFSIVRPFHALTDLRRLYEHDAEDWWTEYFIRRQANHREQPMIDSYWKTVDVIEDDAYVRMCETADYALFYVGHTAGDPAPLAPRYEFLESLRTLPPDEAERRVRRNVELIVATLGRVRFTLDQEHNFLSRKRLIKHIPSVIYRAHENCKALGRMLESELKSVIIANLRRIGMARNDNADVRLRPMPTESYARQYLTAIQERQRELERGEDS